MAPSGNNAVPQRFRQRRPSPSFNDLTVSSATTEQWENLLDRRKKCKDRNLKVIKVFIILVCAMYWVKRGLILIKAES